MQQCLQSTKYSLPCGFCISARDTWFLSDMSGAPCLWRQAGSGGGCSWNANIHWGNVSVVCACHSNLSTSLGAEPALPHPTAADEEKKARNKVLVHS